MPMISTVPIAILILTDNSRSTVFSVLRKFKHAIRA
jgi:hypothetical protein